MNNTLYLRRKSKLCIARGSGLLDHTYTAAFLMNLEGLGYTCSPELISDLSTLSLIEIKDCYQQLMTDIRSMLGADVVYSPMYPNFPQQVMKANEAELYMNAMIHYWGDTVGLRLMPDYVTEARQKLGEKTSMKMINRGSKEDFDQIFTRLLSAKGSLSDTDCGDISWFVRYYGDDIEHLLPEAIPHRETLAFLGANLLRYTSNGEALLRKYVKTATDILRLAVALSAGDVSLAENMKFISFSKRSRRMLLSLLENSGAITEDMLRYADRWKRLGEKLHPKQYYKRYPKSCGAFDIIRNDLPFETFNSKVEISLRSHDIDIAAGLLRARPGEYARRLDKMLRDSKHPWDVINTFTEIASQVSNTVLWQVLTHFKHRNNANPLRTFFPKGNVGKAMAIVNTQPHLDLSLCNEVVTLCENVLIVKYRQLGPLGDVYLDEGLRRYTIPFAMRSASKALKTIARGSRIDLPEGDTLRFFVWWRDGQSRTDIDLTAVGLDRDHRYKTDIAYYNLKGLGGYHSGDITSAPHGASEFIDIDIPKFIEAGIRYVVMTVNSFTEQPFCDLPECFAGFMVRQYSGSGEIYEPTTVENKFDLTANTKIDIPLIVDLSLRQVYWTDIALTKNPGHSNNALNNMSAITILSKSMTSLIKPSLYDLYELHIRARGKRVMNIENANTIFAVDKGIMPTDTDIILSSFL